MRAHRYIPRVASPSAAAGNQSSVEKRDTLRLAAEPVSPQVFCRLKATLNPKRQTLAELSDSGNWYELFDLISTAVENGKASPEVVAARQDLLTQIKLAAEIR